MGAVKNNQVFKGVAINGQIVKGLAKNGVVFWQTFPLLTDYILAYNFNGNTADSSVNGLNGIMTGTLTFDTGRKEGTQSLKFINGCVKTVLPLPINSDKVSISFWIKTTQTETGVVVELSTNFNNNNAFGVFTNDFLVGRVEISDHHPWGYNIGNSTVNINNGNWFHIVTTIDRSLGVTQNQIYVNGSLSYIQHDSYAGDLIGNWANDILFIGQRGASSFPFIGNLQDLKIYNRVLSKEEITALYNE
ncbi:Concanavalin A-like lectin/glucanases superfamily protein [Cruoricaptor ignavus]|uniref:Concanavalin A-like lectin/glucanases superfamily protein n=1 Tax=Cruoricaptor ignavus TaxID=1118202 RepID=A0A1M6HCR1_9FLAO|nr:LamG-like jellyroll fold domain-containing protein [Cruoricaptor ignavus]SHJ19946.1 Concanavalin A-like lectin/glucanases superfamily protein [Cruoricaptor ignavus]